VSARFDLPAWKLHLTGWRTTGLVGVTALIVARFVLAPVSFQFRAAANTAPPPPATRAVPLPEQAQGGIHDN
jgi:hypothetical protein